MINDKFVNEDTCILDILISLPSISIELLSQVFVLLLKNCPNVLHNILGQTIVILIKDLLLSTCTSIIHVIYTLSVKIH